MTRKTAKTIARMLNDGEGIVRTTVIHEGIKYYVIDDLVEQKTLHIPTSEITLYYLTADDTNGVQEGNDETVITSGPLNQDDFYASLIALDDNACIGAYVTYQMRDKIACTYGIS